MRALRKSILFATAVLISVSVPQSQPIDISGIVKDEASGEPLSGFVVSIAGKGLSDTTDITGAFHLLKSTSRVADRSPLQRLVYSARHGFALRMIKDEEVTAEIRNGAGRTLVHGKFSLKAGDWSLKPVQLEPGLYTVMLWTGSRLRALRLTIPNTGKDRGRPAWVLAEMTEAESAEVLSPPIGTVVDSLRLERQGFAPHAVAVHSWSQGGMTVLPKRLAAAAPAAK